MIELSKDRSYDANSCIPEIYDQIETQTNDVTLIRELIRDRKPLG